MSEDYDYQDDDDDVALEDGETTQSIEQNEETPPAISKQEEEDKESYSKRVQKRIDKLTYERNIGNERIQRLESEVEELKQHNQQKQVAQTEQEIDAQRKDLIQQKKDALEIGDYDRVIELDEQLVDLKLKTQPTQSERQPSQSTQQTQRPQQAEQPPPQPQAMADWEAKNAWVYDQAQKARLDKANGILAELFQAGYTADDPDTYEELDRKLKRIVPPPTGAPDRGQITGGSKDTAFTAKDKQMMRDWGLDPENPKHRSEWIKNKSKT